MPRLTKLTVRIGESINKHLLSDVGDNGTYDNVSEYVRNLIRKDKKKKDMLAFDKLKNELHLAFSAPDDSYVTMTADEIIKRNKAQMTNYVIQEAATYRLDDIYRYTQLIWGDNQAETYIRV